MPFVERSMESFLFESIDRESGYYRDSLRTEPQRLKPEDDPNLLRIPPARYAKLRFPPGCPVCHTDFSSSPPDVAFGVVASAFLHFDTKEIVYQLSCGMSSLEDKLHFAKDATIFVTLNKTSGVAACVLYATIPARDKIPYYSIRVISSGSIHHEISADCVSFRNTNAVKANPLDQGSIARNEYHDNKACEASLPASRQDHQDLGLPMAQPLQSLPSSHLENNRPRRKRSPSPTSSTESSSRQGQSTKRKKGQQDDNKGTVNRHIILPKWMDAGSIQGFFSRKNKSKFREDTYCDVALRGKAVEKNPAKLVNLYVTIKGTNKDAVDNAAFCLEDMLVASLPDLDTKRLFMYDIAFDNQSNLKGRGKTRYHGAEIQYQRTPKHMRHRSQWKYIAIVAVAPDESTVEMRALVWGGLAAVQSDTDCFIRIMEMPGGRLAVYIHGSSKETVKTCVDRTRSRIEWALKSLAK